MTVARNVIRMSPIELKLSAQIRLKRISRDAVFKEDLKQLVVPITRTAEPVTAALTLVDQLSAGEVVPEALQLDRLLLITPDGNLVLVECKLWRNPQARREVLAQIIDYAKDLIRLDFEALGRSRDGRAAALATDES